MSIQSQIPQEQLGFPYDETQFISTVYIIWVQLTLYDEVCENFDSIKNYRSYFRKIFNE